MSASGWLPWFHAVVACSWVPHWSCHYFRLETRSTFQVGSWRFSRVDSVLALLVYGVLIGSNIAAVGIPPVRFWVLLVSGLAHLSIGFLHFGSLVHSRSRSSVMLGQVARHPERRRWHSGSAYCASGWHSQLRGKGPNPGLEPTAITRPRLNPHR
jgi:hypothetical protein